MYSLVSIVIHRKKYNSGKKCKFVVDCVLVFALEINVENSSKSHTTRFDIFQEKALFQLVRTREDIV